MAENQTLGIATFAVCLILFPGAWWFSRRGRVAVSLVVIILAGLTLRIFAATDPFLHPWDERYHALVAKNLIRHPLRPTLYDDPVLPYDYRNWNSNHVWVHKQPLPLWAMALSMRIFGVNEVALRLPSVLLSTLAIAMTFLIGSWMFNSSVGLLAAFLHAINGLIIQITAGRMATDHIDLFHLFFVELAVLLAVWCARRGKSSHCIFLGIALGLAILCKWLTALIVLPLWWLLARKRDSPKKTAVNFLIVAGVCCAVFLPWQIYTHSAFPREARWESAFNVRHITEALDGHAGSWTFYFRGLSHYGYSVILPVAWFLFRAIRRREDDRSLMAAAWFLVPFAFFTIVKTKMVTYTLFTAPSLFLMSAAFLHTASEKRAHAGYRLLLPALFTLLIAEPAFQSVRTIKLFRPGDRNNSWAIALRKLGKEVTDPKAVFFNAPPIETMFYTSGTAYAGLPTREQMVDLKNRGYSIYILDRRNVTEELRREPLATVIRL